MNASAPDDEAPGTGVVHLIDDSPPERDAIRLLLEREGFAVRTHRSAKSLLSHVAPGEPGCVVTDLSMPDMTGLELLAEFNRRRLALQFVAITRERNIALAVRAMKLGAADVIEKPFDDQILVAAVRSALAHACNRDVHKTEAQLLRDRRATLTGRQNQVLAELLKGASNKEIGAELGLSVRTVENHRAEIMARMRAKSLPHLIWLACIAASDVG